MALWVIHTADPRHTQVDSISGFSSTPLGVFTEATEAELKKFTIKTVMKPCELEPITIWLLKRYTTELPPFTMAIVDTSLKEACVPTSMKKACTTRVSTPEKAWIRLKCFKELSPCLQFNLYLENIGESHFFKTR